MTGAPALPVLAHLKFTKQGRERLDEVLAFLDTLEARDAALGRKARTELTERLLYLDGFGGTVSQENPRRRFEVTLGWDIYPLCFAITWSAWNAKTEQYCASMRGGLVWQGGPGDSGSVCLDRELLWSIHT